MGARALHVCDNGSNVLLVVRVFLLNLLYRNIKYHESVERRELHILNDSISTPVMRYTGNKEILPPFLNCQFITLCNITYRRI